MAVEPVAAQASPRACLIRQLTPTDRHAVAFLMLHLGRESRYLRFHGIKRDMHTEVIRLTDTDHWHHEALLALAHTPRTPIGVVEYVRLDEFDHAEIAIVVADDWQRRGVGRALLEALRPRPIAAGVHQLTASVLLDNHPALRLATQFGPARLLSIHGDAIELRIRL
jgi:acetyltransferase